MLPVQSLVPLALLTLLLLAASLFALTALGHFASAARQEALRRGYGVIVLWGSMLAVGLSVLMAIGAAWWLVPWYAAIIAGGLAILAAPLILQSFSDAFVDSQGALLWFAAATSAPAIILGWLLSH